MAVQLPDFATVGSAPPQAVGGLPSFAPNDPGAQGEAALGTGIAKAGGAAEDFAAYGQMAKNRMDRASAQADFIGRIIPITEQLKTETDPAKITDLRGAYQSALDTASNAISDPSARELWQKQQAQHVAAGQAHADLRGKEVYFDRWRAGLDQNAATLGRNTAVADPSAVPAALSALKEQYSAATDAGALTHEQAFTRQKAAEHQMIAALAQNLATKGRPDQAKAVLDQYGGELDAITRANLDAHIETKGSAARIGGAASRALGIAVPAPDSPATVGGPDQVDNWETRNNNFGGLRKVGVPAAGPNAGGFQSFATPEDGVRAIDSQLQRYYQGATTGKPITTLRGIVSTWAPPSENDTPALIARASKVTGFGPDDELTLDAPTRAKLIEATIRNEQGGKLPIDPAVITKVTGAPAVSPSPPAPPSDTNAAARNRTGLPTLAEVWQKVQSDPSLRNEQEKLLAFNHAKTFYDAQEADAARAERIAAAQQKQAMATRENEIYADTYSAQPKITASQIATDPAFNSNPERRKQMIELINNPPGSGVPAPQSYAAALSLLDRIRRPDGDPSKITDVAPIYDAAINGKLNKQDFEFVRKEFDQIRTPGGEILGKRRADFIKGIGPQIDKSNPLAGKIDETGKAKLYQFEWLLDQKMDEYRKAGKNPSDLLDPSKPDYMGKPEALAPYQTSMQDSIQEIVKSITRQPIAAGAAQVTQQNSEPQTPIATAPIPPRELGSAPTATPEIPERKPGESIPEYLNRTSPSRR